MGVLRVKEGVSFPATTGEYTGSIAPGGFRILSALDQTANALSYDLTVTSAADGIHSGPNDPHFRSEAYDVRTHDIPPEQKENVLQMIMGVLPDGRFFGFIEDPNSDNEHIHVQVRRGTTYP